MDGLVDHHQRQAILNRRSRHILPRGIAKQAVDLGVDLFLPFLLLRRVEVEAASALASLEAGLDETRHGLTALEAAVCKGLPEVLRHVGADVDPHLVDQRQGTHRVAEVLHRPVHVLDAGALLHQQDSLVQIGGEDAGGVEARPVLDHDAGLPLGGTKGMDGGHHPWRGRLTDHDLQQRHLGHRREVVHPDHPLRVACPDGNLRDRKGGGV